MSALVTIAELLRENSMSKAAMWNDVQVVVGNDLTVTVSHTKTKNEIKTLPSQQFQSLER
jgi:hypothetical protein